MAINRVDTPDSISSYVLELPSKIESFMAVENFVEELKEKYNISSNIHANMLTCLSEALNNAVIHGNELNESKKISFKLTVQENNLVFSIQDEGKGFNYNNIPDPTDPENLEKLTGRGVFIMRKLADLCTFNPSGNQIELRFNI